LYLCFHNFGERIEMLNKNKIGETAVSKGGKTFYALAFTLLLVVAMAVPLMNQNTLVAKAQTTTIPRDMLQYEWTQLSSDATHSFSSDGSEPIAPNVKWRAQIPGASGYLTAFNGLVFAEGVTSTYALDGGTGDTVWIAEGIKGGKIKIDDNYMIIGTKCVKIADGTVVWTAPAGFAAPGSTYQGLQYIPELSMLCDQNNGWSLPDPTEPPVKVWTRVGQQLYGVERCLAAGDGKLFLGSPENMLICVDALTGDTLWMAPTTSAFFYGGCFVDGTFIHGGLDNNMHCWDADTGELLWTYNPETWYGMWASAAACAYGMIYEHNQDSHLYAINVATGEMVWRQKGPGIGYSNTLTVAGGKVYCQMGDNQYRDFNTGEYAYSEFNCYDAYTGELIWTMPLENGAPFNLQCNAYGNLYMIPTESPQVPGQWRYSMGGTGSLNEVWCISGDAVDWSMYGADPEHSLFGSGPTNLAYKWSYQADASIQTSPTLANGVAYFGTNLGTLYAVDANSGTKLWSFQTDHILKSSVAVDSGKVYTGGDDGNVYCLNAATGAKIWESSVGGIKVNPLADPTLGLQSLHFVGAENTRSSPTVVDGKVYVGSLDSNLYCLDANSGAVIWKFNAGGPIFATPTIVDNAIYIPASTPSPTGTFYKLDLSGNVIWQKEFPYLLNLSPPFGFYLLASATVAPDLDLVFLRNGFRMNYALNATTGDTVWTYDGKYNPGTPNQLGGVTQYMPMLYQYGLVYFNDFYGVTCLDALNGSEVWYSYSSRENLAQYLAYSYNRIYTVSETGVLYVLDALTGQRLSYYEFTPSRSQLRSAPIPYNGSLYVGANDWNLYCFCEARLMDDTHPSPTITQPTTTPLPISTINPPIQTPISPLPSSAVVPPSSAEPTTTYIAIAVAVVVIVAVAAALVLRRRK
jgi:outer membrane protein assembly factor BamB